MRKAEERKCQKREVCNETTYALLHVCPFCLPVNITKTPVLMLIACTGVPEDRHAWNSSAVLGESACLTSYFL